MSTVHVFYAVCLLNVLTVFLIYSVLFRPPQDQNLESEPAQKAQNQTTAPPPAPLNLNCPAPNIQHNVDSHESCDQKAGKQSIPPPWQAFQHAGLTFFLYSAYWDERRAGREAVHIAALMQDGDRSKIRMFCHFWWGNELISTTEPALYHVLLDMPASIRFIIITCPTAKRYSVSDSMPQHPRAVSVAPCGTPTACKHVGNFMPVIFNPLRPGEKKKNFAVCHKALYYHNVDPSRLIIDWFEIQRILGFKKVFMYEYFPHPNVTKVLDYYVKEGFAELKQHLIPFASSEPQAMLSYLKTYVHDGWINELVCYHDCFFRSMYHFKYITLQDVDEFFMPAKHKSMAELMQLLEMQAVEDSNEPVAAFVFQNNVFPDSDDFEPQLVPKGGHYTHSHMLQHFVRMTSPNYLNKPKLLFNTSEVVGLHNHWVEFSLSHWKQQECREFRVDPQVARNHHYCLNGAKGCANVDRVDMQLDTTIWRFKDELHSATTKVRLLVGLDL